MEESIYDFDELKMYFGEDYWVTDNNYLVRTLIFQITDVNSITYTPLGEKSLLINKLGR